MIELTRENLEKLGFDEDQIRAMTAYNMQPAESEYSIPEKVVKFEATERKPVERVEIVEDNRNKELKVTKLSDIEEYKNGVIVELPPFGEGQPFVARLTRPSMLQLVKTGKIPNSLIDQATSLFAKGAGALDGQGKGRTNANELFDVIDTIVESALQEPTLAEIRSVGMELSDDQLMAIFSYTQKGVKALEAFRTI